MTADTVLESRLREAMARGQTSDADFAAEVRRRIAAREASSVTADRAGGEVAASVWQRHPTLARAVSLLPPLWLPAGKALATKPAPLALTVLAMPVLIVVMTVLTAFWVWPRALRRRGPARPGVAPSARQEALLAAMSAWWREHLWAVGLGLVLCASVWWFSRAEGLAVLLLGSTAFLVVVLGRLGELQLMDRQQAAGLCGAVLLQVGLGLQGWLLHLDHPSGELALAVLMVGWLTCWWVGGMWQRLGREVGRGWRGLAPMERNLLLACFAPLLVGGLAALGWAGYRVASNSILAGGLAPADEVRRGVRDRSLELAVHSVHAGRRLGLQPDITDLHGRLAAPKAANADRDLTLLGLGLMPLGEGAMEADAIWPARRAPGSIGWLEEVLVRARALRVLGAEDLLARDRHAILAQLGELWDEEVGLLRGWRDSGFPLVRHQLTAVLLFDLFGVPKRVDLVAFRNALAYRRHVRRDLEAKLACAILDAHYPAARPGWAQVLLGYRVLWAAVLLVVITVVMTWRAPRPEELDAA
ncbi:MAG: hypothetical protein AAF628_34775 [Planctomycetota bacterium]